MSKMYEFISIARKLTAFDENRTVYAVTSKGWIFSVKTFRKDTPIKDIINYIENGVLTITGFDCNLLEIFNLSSLEDRWEFLLPSYNEKELEAGYEYCFYTGVISIFDLLKAIKEKYPDDPLEASIYDYQEAYFNLIKNRLEKLNKKVKED